MNPVLLANASPLQVGRVGRGRVQEVGGRSRPRAQADGQGLDQAEVRVVPGRSPDQTETVKLARQRI